MIHLDATLLIDRMREQARREHGPATRWLEDAADEALAISVFVHCELLAGAALAAHPAREREKIARACAGVAIVYPRDGFEQTYADAYAFLSRHGVPIGQMDLLIGCTAIQAACPLVTRNQRHFDRIPGLAVLGY